MEEESPMQQLRSKATEHLLREEWAQSIDAYSQFISLCTHQINSNHQNSDALSKLHRSLCLALSNRAESRFKLKDFSQALDDCDQALQIDTVHFKSLICKECFNSALLDQTLNGESLKTVNGYVNECKRLENQSRTGTFDVSDWVLNGFRGKTPDLGEFVGPVLIKRSEISGRGLFAAKNLDCGSLILVTKAVAVERCILPIDSKDLRENAQLVMWKNFIKKVTDSVSKCPETRRLIGMLSNGEKEDELETPNVDFFRPHSEKRLCLSYEQNKETEILSILDVNSMVEDSISSKVLGKNNGYYGVGLWLLPSFINHSCNPNSRRLHIGDYIVILASRNVKSGEEITFPYFDILSPPSKRVEMSKPWGFQCHCKRCRFEEEMFTRQEVKDLEISIERGVDVGCASFKLEEGMKKWGVRGKEKGYLRASFWGAVSEAYRSETVARRWGRQLPAAEVVAESVGEAVGSDERVVETVVERVKKGVGGGAGNGAEVVEKAMKLGRGVYGKIVKRQVLRNLLELPIS
ncbi:hypothetical protein V2J09_012984 [Rumex salicifolius]